MELMETNYNRIPAEKYILSICLTHPRTPQIINLSFSVTYKTEHIYALPTPQALPLMLPLDLICFA